MSSTAINHFPSNTDESLVSVTIKSALDRWASGVQLREAGDFLHKVLTNDLAGAVRAADQYNIQVLPAIVEYCIRHLPAESWGTPAKYDKWLRAHV